MDVKKILLPVDGSQSAEVAIEMVRKMAASFGAKIYVINVVELRREGAIHEAYIYGGDVIKQFQTFSENIIKDISQKLEGYDFEAVSVVGHPADEILNMAQEKDVDVIVMATHGMTAMRRFLVGSVTNYVVHHSKKPVLVIPVEK